MKSSSRAATFAAFVVASVTSLLAFGCASSADSPDQPAKGATSAAAADASWELVGWRVIGCCCPAPCPCRINKKPSNCHGCDHTDIVHVDRGSLNGTTMDGVTWVVVGRGFGEDENGNWVYVYVDQKASDAQVAALQKMLGDTVTAWGAKGPYLAGKFVGLREVPMTVRADGETKGYGVSIPGILEFQTRAIFNPGHDEPVVSTGIMDTFGDRFVHADALVHTLDDKTTGYKWDLTGRQANQATFVLNQARVDQGGIGWGCWSAHADFGDQGKYVEQMLKHD